MEPADRLAEGQELALTDGEQVAQGTARSKEVIKHLTHL